MTKSQTKEQSDGRAWHAMEPDGVLEGLETSRDGLDASEVEKRRERYGKNKLPEREEKGPVEVFLRQFRDPLIYILLIAGAVSLAIGNLNNAIFIFVVLLINAGLGTFQEWRAESSAGALRHVIKITAHVIRDGERKYVDSEELVPGDIVTVSPGVSVPADLRLLSAKGVRTDESLLTGESVPVGKEANADVKEDASVGDRSTMLHAGSLVIGGEAAGVVCRTGVATEIGRIAGSLTEESQVPPLVIKLRRFTRLIGVIVLVAIAILGIIHFFRGAPLMEVFFLGVALAVSAIPAGLPVAITVAMSIASNRMAKRNVIVRQLPAVEGLGACTLIACDKTGTLTMNRLTVKRLVDADGCAANVGGDGYDLEGDLRPDDSAGGSGDQDKHWRLFAESGVLCNGAELGNSADDHRGDPMDIAFLVLGGKLGIERDALLDEMPEEASIPFESERRFAASFHRSGDEVVAHVKGAAEVLAEMCESVDAEQISSLERELAEEGYRVLAVARGAVSPGENCDYDESTLNGLTFLGLAGLIDPIREEVPDAVEKCRSAGVEIRMITGDHPATGLAVARQIGLADEDSEAIIGNELLGREDKTDDGDLKHRIGDAAVFARIEPTQKTDIVAGLQDLGHFVAVTGDGVNDAPALRDAHIGVAMGRSGTDVARRAADLILTDDNFASIVNGIEEGRIAYDNVRRVTWLLLSTGAAEVLIFFLALLTGLPLPLTAIQLLWLNLVTNGIQDVALAFERGDPDILDRKPRPPDQPIFDHRMIEQTVLSGGFIGCVGFGVYYYLLEVMGMSEFDARNHLLLLMVLFENVHAFSCRSEKRSVFRIPLVANLFLVASVLAAQAIHIGAMFVPGLSGVLEIGPVAPTMWLILLPVALTLIPMDEMAKWIRRRSG